MADLRNMKRTWVAFDREGQILYRGRRGEVFSKVEGQAEEENDYRNRSVFRIDYHPAGSGTPYQHLSLLRFILNDTGEEWAKDALDERFGGYASIFYLRPKWAFKSEPPIRQPYFDLFNDLKRQYEDEHNQFCNSVIL